MKSRNGNKEKYPDNSEVKRIEAAFKDKLIKNGVDTEAKSSVAPSADEQFKYWIETITTI